MERSEYDRYGDNPEIAARRREVREAFLENLRAAFIQSDEEIDQHVSEYLGASGTHHGRWETKTLGDILWLQALHIGIE